MQAPCHQERVDQFKKGNEQVNFHARDFLRRLDSLSSDKLFDGGIRIGRKQGKISIKLDRELHPDLRQSFSPGLPDHRILNTAYNLQKSLPKRTVILITKDVNLRMKSKAVGLMALVPGWAVLGLVVQTSRHRSEARTRYSSAP